MKTQYTISKALISSLLMSALVASSASATLIPSNGSSSPSADPLFGYQYYLQYTGQEIYRDITDITSAKVILNPNNSVDIGLPQNSNLDQQMKRDIVVAILDSGVDLKHPDIVNSLFHNTPECVSNDIPFGATEDKDKNGYIGDCIGWNFTPANPKGNNRPEDDLGHGTHVAGIIAATRNNGVGISGVSNRIKILPLKVTGAKDAQIRPGQPTQPGQGLSLADRMTKAIQYATQMKVDVINMSLGWPSASDSSALRQAMQEALSSGITIVAAAGNNDTSSHIFPCAYEGVICVGATGIDNKLADFSNFGGHVDMSAPGEEIMSLFPASLTPIIFSGQQYEIKNGTSQAAPLVAASAAVLKGIFPGISEDEIKARLWLSAQNLGPSPEDKFTQFGTLKLQKAVDIKPQPLTAPIFKNLDLVRFTMDSKNVLINLPIKNYWTADSNIKVLVESLSPQFTINQPTMNLNLASSEKSVLQIHGTLQDASASSEIKIQVTISSPNQSTKAYPHNIQLARSIVNDPKLIKLPLRTHAIGPSPQLARIQDLFDQSENPEYFWQEITPNATGASDIKIHVLKLVNGAFEEQAPLVMNNVNQLITVLKIPMMNQQQGYWIGTISPTADGKGKLVKYFNFNLNSERARVQQINFAPETAVIDNTNYRNLNFVNMKLKDGSNDSLSIPVFINSGKIPKLDINPDPFQFEVNSPMLRIFFLEPQFLNGEWSFITRNYNNYAFSEQLRKELRLQFKDDLVLVGFLPQLVGQTSIRALYSYGQSDLRKFAVISANANQLLSHTYTLEYADYKSTQLDKGEMSSVIDLSSGKAMKSSATAFASFVTPLKALLQFLSPIGTTRPGNFLIESSSPQDPLAGFIQSYQIGNTYYSFSQSKSKLIYQINSPDGSSARFENPINRSQLIPGSLFTESFSPVSVSAGSRIKPALYVDSSSLYGQNVYLRVGDQNGLSAPASLSIEIPNGCVPKMPQKMGAKAQFYFMMLCQTPNGQELRALPMEE